MEYTFSTFAVVQKKTKKKRETHYLIGLQNTLLFPAHIM